MMKKIIIAALAALAICSGLSYATMGHPGLKLWLPLNSNSTDISGSGYNGTDNGNTYVAGEIGGASSFDGLNDYINISSGYTNLIKGDETHTISTRFKVASFSGEYPITGITTNQFFLQVTSARVYWAYNASTYRTYTVSISSAAWHHIAAVKTGSGDSGNLYLDGVLQTSYTGSLTTTTSVNSNLEIQSSIYPRAILIDDFQIYNFPLSASDVHRVRMGLHPLQRS